MTTSFGESRSKRVLDLRDAGGRGIHTCSLRVYGTPRTEDHRGLGMQNPQHYGSSEVGRGRELEQSQQFWVAAAAQWRLSPLAPPLLASVLRSPPSQAPRSRGWWCARVPGGPPPTAARNLELAVVLTRGSGAHSLPSSGTAAPCDTPQPRR